MVNTLRGDYCGWNNIFLCMPLEILNYRAHSSSQENANKGVVLSVLIYFKIWQKLGFWLQLLEISRSIFLQASLTKIKQKTLECISLSCIRSHFLISRLVCLLVFWLVGWLFFHFKSSLRPQLVLFLIEYMVQFHGSRISTQYIVFTFVCS